MTMSGLKEALSKVDTVFNAVGPYHLHGLKVVEAAIETGTHYVDMGDDHEPAEELFFNPEWDKRAKDAGVAVLTGCGIMPGLSGVLARYGCDSMDVPRRVNIWFSWNYSLNYPAAIQHFLRINSGLAPQYIDGDYVKPGAFANREEIDFLPPVGVKEVYYTGVPDPVTISQSLPGLTEVTASGGLHQAEGNDFMETMVRWGFSSYDNVPGLEISPDGISDDVLCRRRRGRRISTSSRWTNQWRCGSGWRERRTGRRVGGCSRRRTIRGGELPRWRRWPR